MANMTEKYRIRLVDRQGGRSPAAGSASRQTKGNGCVERVIRSMLKQLLWLPRFRTIEELSQALRHFAHRFNNHRINGRIGYRSPAAHLRILLGEAARTPTPSSFRNGCVTQATTAVIW
jgi:hypothetical protein